VVLGGSAKVILLRKFAGAFNASFNTRQSLKPLFAYGLTAHFTLSKLIIINLKQAALKAVQSAFKGLYPSDMGILLLYGIISCPILP
jgi:hypothetical protein